MIAYNLMSLFIKTSKLFRYFCSFCFFINSIYLKKFLSRNLG
jgi:hypothetical protein